VLPHFGFIASCSRGVLVFQKMPEPCKCRRLVGMAQVKVQDDKVPKEPTGKVGAREAGKKQQPPTAIQF